MCIDGIFEGPYSEQNSDGWSFTGIMKQGKKTGLGVDVDYHGTTFKGEFKDDKKDGFGCEISSNGETFIGKFDQGVRNGIGLKEKDGKYSIVSYKNGALIKEVAAKI